MKHAPPDARVDAGLGEQASRDGVERALRASLSSGTAPVAVIDNWAAIAAWADDNVELFAEVVAAAADTDRSIAAWDAADVQSVAIAFVGARGGLHASDARFKAWIGDPSGSIGCTRLVRAAFAGRRVIGLVETIEHGVLTVFATTDTEVERWWRLAGLDAAATPTTKVAALIAFAPSRSRQVVLEAASAFRLSPLETRLVAALIEAPTLAEAAHAMGVGRETAKDALTGAMRKTGVSSTSQLVARVLELSRRGPAMAAADGMIGAALGLSPMETRVARQLATGYGVKDIATNLGISPHTAVSYRRAIFAKARINRVRDLSRLIAEVGGLDRLTSAAEVALDPEAGRDHLRMLVDRDGRTVAFFDYGPAKGLPVILCHGSNTGYAAPPPLLASLQARGRRVIVPHRPGFGLTTAADEDHVATASQDLSLILDHLRCGRADIVSRSSMSSIAFAADRPERIRRLVLLNPQARRPADRSAADPLTVMAQLLLEHPRLIDPFAHMLARQSRSEVVAAVFRRVGKESDADRLCLEAPDTLAFLVRDAQGLLGRTVAGFVTERRIWAKGWRPPGAFSGRDLVLAQSGELKQPAAPTIWPTMTQAEFVTIPDAGWFVAFTHPDAVAQLLDR